ncbi:MAG: hypothetical protein ACOZBL_02775 [Patescibacteria group bacterium]
MKKYLVDLLLILNTVGEHTSIFRNRDIKSKNELVIVITSER